MKVYTLSEVAEIMAGENKKGLAHHLLHAQLIWNELLRKTLWSFSATWLDVHKGTTHPYIIIPDNMDEVLGLAYEETDGTLSYLDEVSRRLSFLPKPTQKSCGCKTACDCGSCCAAAHTEVTFEKKEHIIGGAPFYEKIWKEVCPNGDVVQYREVPTKEPFDGGYNVVYVTEQKRLCKVTVKPCGCIEETASNATLLQSCGFHGAAYGCIGCPPVTCTTTKVQREGNKLYLIGGTVRSQYLLYYRESEACSASLVPEFALRTLVTGTIWSKSQFAGEHPNIVGANESQWLRMKGNLIRDLNPWDPDYMITLSDEPAKW